MRIALLSIALAGCATVPNGPTRQCNADPIRDLVGRPATAELGTEAQRLSGAARLRWIRRGDVVTMDYSSQRLNVHLDEQGRVERFACG